MSTITWVLSHLVGVSSSPESNVVIRTAFKTPYSPIHIRAFLKSSFGMGGGESRATGEVNTVVQSTRLRIASRTLLVLFVQNRMNYYMIRGPSRLHWITYY